MQYRRGSDVGNLCETVLTWRDSTACAFGRMRSQERQPSCSVSSNNTEAA